MLLTDQVCGRDFQAACRDARIATAAEIVSVEGIGVMPAPSCSDPTICLADGDCLAQHVTLHHAADSFSLIASVLHEASFKLLLTDHCLGSLLACDC